MYSKRKRHDGPDAGQKNRPQEQDDRMPLGRKNYIWMLAGVALVILGFVLMAGGGSDDPNVFDYGMFSFRRITLAPIVVLGGFFVTGFGIMKRFK